jgi:lysozyme
MTRAVTERAKALARKREKLELAAYLPTPDDRWTIGYGHTRGVHPNQTCTEDQAEQWLSVDFAVAAKALERKIGEDVVMSLTDNQHDALCDFVLNLGTGDPAKPEWQIWGLLRKRAFDQIPAQFARFVYQGKTKLGGLVVRRNDEIALWSEAEPGSDDKPTSSAVTRTADTPPAPAPATLTPAHIATAAVAAAGGIAEGAKQVSALISPYADRSDFVQHALSYAATVGAGAAVAVALFTWLAHRRAAR